MSALRQATARAPAALRSLPSDILVRAPRLAVSGGIRILHLAATFARSVMFSQAPAQLPVIAVPLEVQAAGVVLHVLRSMLGLCTDIPDKQLDESDSATEADHSRAQSPLSMSLLAQIKNHQMEAIWATGLVDIANSVETDAWLAHAQYIQV